MRYRSILLSTLLLFLAAPGLALASSGDLGSIIESFVSRHFPDTTNHPWIINSAQWDGDEMVIDVDTVVVEKQRLSIENRNLLLIVKGELAAAQRIPLENGPDCQPEETYDAYRTVRTNGPKKHEGPRGSLLLGLSLCPSRVHIPGDCHTTSASPTCRRHGPDGDGIYRQEYSPLSRKRDR